jgi:hypothetical protein
MSANPRVSSCCRARRVRDLRHHIRATHSQARARRTNNTAIFTAVGLFWEHKPQGEVWWLAFPLAMLLGQCFAWFYLLRSYRLLNTAKYGVVGALETRLPASPYWVAEWVALGEGKDWKKYWPLSHIEGWIPIFFAALYVGGFVALIAMGRR